MKIIKKHIKGKKSEKGDNKDLGNKKENEEKNYFNQENNNEIN